MKRFLTISALACAVFMVSCNDEPKNENAETPAMTQAQQDSAVNARVAEEMKAKAESDSVVNALAQMKADSMKMAEANNKPVTTVKSRGTRTVIKTQPAPPPPPKPTTIGNGKPKMGEQQGNQNGNNSGNTIGNGKPRMGGDNK